MPEQHWQPLHAGYEQHRRRGGPRSVDPITVTRRSKADSNVTHLIPAKETLERGGRVLLADSYVFCLDSGVDVTFLQRSQRPTSGQDRDKGFDPGRPFQWLVTKLVTE